MNINDLYRTLKKLSFYDKKKSNYNKKMTTTRNRSNTRDTRDTRNKRKKSEYTSSTKSYKTDDMIKESTFNTLSVIPEVSNTTRSYTTDDMIEDSMFNTLSVIPEKNSEDSEVSEDSENNEFTKRIKKRVKNKIRKMGRNTKNSNKNKNSRSTTTSKTTSKAVSRAKKTSKIIKVNSNIKIPKNKTTGITAPGGKAEKNFCDRLQPIINKPLTPQEKNILLDAINNFNNIYPNYFTQKLRNDIRNKADFKITKIEQVGATKSTETKKNDILMTTNVKFGNNDFSFGISYKDGEAQTIQSWSSIDTWRRIFSNQESNSSSGNSGDSILADVTSLLVEITTKHSERETDYYSIGSTIHLQPLNKEINILPSLDNEITDNLNDMEKKEVLKLKKNISSENESERRLTKYLNNVLIENNSIFHYILFGTKTENCLFYYKDLKINYNERKNFETIRDLFEDLGSRLYYAGNIHSEFSALKLLRNKIKVVPRYVYATRTPENKKIEFLVAWKPKNSTISKGGCLIQKNKDLLPNGSFHSFHDFESYRLSKLNYENLRNYFQSQHIILANEQRIQSRNFINLPKYITDKISGIPIQESIRTLKILFDCIYLPSLFYILPKNKFLNYMRTTYRWLNEYTKENQLKKAKKYLQCNMQMIINYDKDSNNILDCSRYELKSSTLLRSVNFSTIENLFININSESFINYINCFYEGYKKFENIVNNFKNGSGIYYYDLDEYLQDLNNNQSVNVDDYYKKGYIIDFNKTNVLIQNENEIKEFEFIKQPFLKFTNE